MFIFEPDPHLIAQLEAEDTNVIAFPKPQPKPDDCGPICAPCDVEPTDEPDPEGAA